MVVVVSGAGGNDSGRGGRLRCGWLYRTSKEVGKKLSALPSAGISEEVEARTETL